MSTPMANRPSSPSAGNPIRLRRPPPVVSDALARIAIAESRVELSVSARRGGLLGFVVDDLDRRRVADPRDQDQEARRDDDQNRSTVIAAVAGG
jgi:hypothetical protein